MKVGSIPARLLFSALLVGCSARPMPPGPDGTILTTLPIVVDPMVPVGQEVYECFLFDATALQGAPVHALHWTPPSGALRLHHAMMFATSEPGIPGVVPCEPMPPPVVVLPLYAPGGETTALADGVSIVVPASAANVFVELHLFRAAAGSANASVDFLASVTPPEHLAGWVDDYVTVPSLPAHALTTAAAQCRFAGPAHVVGSWPHMHRLGAHFEGTIVRADGSREPLLTVPVWDFSHEPLYTVDASLEDGDAVETACSWNNTTDATVMAGPYSTDEMCNQGLVVWPRESATCIR